MRAIHLRRCPVLLCLTLWILALGAIYFYITQSPQLNQRWPHYSSIPFHRQVAKIDSRSGDKDSLHNAQLLIESLHFKDSKPYQDKSKPRNPLSVPRIAEYCNPPTWQVTGAEGNVPWKYNLEQVYVVIRHGDRSPMHSFRNHPNPSLSCELDQDRFLSNLQLASFIQTMLMYQGKQHSASGFRNWALFPDHKICEGSQLTGLGVLQHLQIGKFLKGVYDQKWQLFGNTFSSDQVYIRSTEYSRTYQSVVALLFGFLPRFNLTELLIERSPNLLMCSERYFGSSCHCPVIYKLKQTTDKLASFLIQNNSQYLYLAKKIASVYKLRSSQLPWPSAMLDVFMTYACHDISLPCNSNGQCIDWMILENLWVHLDQNGIRQVTTDNVNLKRNRLATHPFLHEISTRMKAIMKDSSESKFLIYAGHDITMTPLLTALGIHSGKWPPYASRFIFELYSHIKGHKKRFYLRMLYNGKDLTHQTSFCSHISPDALCPLEKFTSFVSRDSLRTVGITNYEDACQQ